MLLQRLLIQRLFFSLSFTHTRTGLLLEAKLRLKLFVRRKYELVESIGFGWELKVLFTNQGNANLMLIVPHLNIAQ